MGVEIRIVNQFAQAIRENIARVIVGKEAVVDLLLVALLCEGHVLIEDVPGIGKTTLAKALACSLDCSFRRIQFTPDLLPSDITGVNVFNQKTGEFEFRPGPVMAQIVLADEINRAGPRTQSALLEAMQERQVTADGITHPLPRPFLVLATQNPVELGGTFPLPEAQIDRFLLRVGLGYPDAAEERAILRRFRKEDPLKRLQPVVSANEVLAMGGRADRGGVRRGLGRPGGGVLLFFLASLSGLALASLVSVQRHAHGEARPGISRFWLVVVASVILTILTLGVLLSQVLAPELIMQLLGLFRPIVNLLAQGLYFLLTAIVALVFIVLGPIIEFLRPRSPAAPLPTPQSDPFENFRREMERAAQGSQAPPGWVVTLVQALLVLALLVAVLFFLSRAFRRLRLLDSEGVEEMRESIGAWALLWAQLRALLRRLRRRRVPAVAAGPFLPLEAVPGEAGRLSIREVYRPLLALARERGVPRARSQTPYEYERVLGQAFARSQEEVEVITEAYVAARYGLTSPPKGVVSRVNRAWQAMLRRSH